MTVFESCLDRSVLSCFYPGVARARAREKDGKTLKRCVSAGKNKLFDCCGFSFCFVIVFALFEGFGIY